MNWNWQIIIDSLPELLSASVMTVRLVLLSGILGLLLAVPMALARMSKHRWVQALPFAYIFFFRGTPLLVQIFLIYYGLAQFPAINNDSTLWKNVLSQPYWCAIIAFTLNTAAYIAEIIRGAVRSIPVGELEAADAIGMSYGQKLTRIILPRAFGMMIPAYGNEVIFMLKGSALASTITLMDLMGQTKFLAAKNSAILEMYFAAGMLYLLMSWVFMGVFRLLENHFSRHLRYTPLNKKAVIA